MNEEIKWTIKWACKMTIFGVSTYLPTRHKTNANYENLVFD